MKLDGEICFFARNYAEVCLVASLNAQCSALILTGKRNIRVEFNGLDRPPKKSKESS